MIRQEKGSALMAVLVITTVLFVLGSSILSVSTNNANSARMQDKSLQAYYIARSGADAAAAWIINNPNDSENLFGEISDRTCLGSGEFEVTVKEEDNGDILIASTGYVDDVSRDVSLVLTASGEGEETQIPLDVALFTEGKIKLSAEINGTAATNTTAQNGVELDWGAEISGDLLLSADADPGIVVSAPSYSNLIAGDVLAQSESRTYPAPEFPDFPDELPYRGSFTAGWSPSPPYYIAEDGDYSNIIVESTLIIDTGSSGDTRRIRADSLTVSGDGDILLQGEGKLIFYIDNNFQISNGGTINYPFYPVARKPEKVDPNDVTPDDLRIYYKGENMLSFAGGTFLAAHLFVEKASINLGGGHILFGSIITSGSNFSITGGAKAGVEVVYAPLAKVTMLQGGTIAGAVICQEFESGGGSILTYDQSITERFTIPVTVGTGTGVSYVRERWE